MSVLSQFFGGGGGIGDSVPDTIKVIEFLLVGGGGGGGCSSVPVGPSGSGGGAGAMVEGTDFLVNNGETFSIVIGAGGAGGVGPSSDPGEPGSQSLFGFIFAGGGGSGGGNLNPNSGQFVRGTNGGSGGGGQGSSPSPSSSSSGTGIGGVVGTGSLNYRYDVFNKHTQISTFASPGTNCGSPSAAPGGGAGGGEFGKSNSITGSPVTYAAGGSLPPPPVATSGTANTGNGGNGGNTGGGGSGGSGVCIIRWPTAYPDASSVTGNTPTPAQPGYYVYRWNGDGSITF